MQALKATIFILALLGFASAITLKSHQSSTSEFCWKDSYGRGVGSIPSECPSHKVKIGLLCYDPCPHGYSRFVLDCHQNCLDGWRDDGLFCRLAEYGRGSGYPWEFGDWFDDDGMRERCEDDHGYGNCEEWGLMYYPKCKPGYENVACCICRPAHTPDCNALGYNGGFDLSCAKTIKVGNPSTMNCPSHLTYDAGLCYERCREYFHGVGPVCWGEPPRGWVDCGMGAAKDSTTCANTILDEISSVGSLALNLVTFGAGKAATITKDAAQAAKLKEMYDTLKAAIKASDKVEQVVNAGTGKFPIIEAGKSTVDLLKADDNDVTPEDILRVSSQIASLADPTGASGVVSSFSYPKCDQIHP
jgi:hypothetical protein